MRDPTKILPGFCFSDQSFVVAHKGRTIHKSVGAARRKKDGKIEAAVAPVTGISAAAALATFAERSPASASVAPPSAAEMVATTPGKDRFNERLPADPTGQDSATLLVSTVAWLDDGKRPALARAVAGRVACRNELGATVPALDEEDAANADEEDGTAPARAYVWRNLHASPREQCPS